MSILFIPKLTGLTQSYSVLSCFILNVKISQPWERIFLCLFCKSEDRVRLSHLQTPGPQEGLATGQPNKHLAFKGTWSRELGEFQGEHGSPYVSPSVWTGRPGRSSLQRHRREEGWEVGWSPGARQTPGLWSETAPGTHRVPLTLALCWYFAYLISKSLQNFPKQSRTSTTLQTGKLRLKKDDVPEVIVSQDSHHGL